MKKTIHLLALSILFAVLSDHSAKPPRASSESDQPVAKYRVIIPGGKPVKIFVEARLTVSAGNIFMNPFGADHLPNGWASFIRDLQATDIAGSRLLLKSEQNGAWSIGTQYTGEAMLKYEIDLSFVHQRWPAGNEQAGFFEDDALFLVTRPLFITSESPGRRQVTFEVPDGWRISTPWERSPADSTTFFAKDQTDLLNNTVVLGRHAEHRFQEGPFTFILALPGRIRESSDLIVSTLKRPVRAYHRLFDRTPRTTFMMTLFYADQEDGEGYTRSAAFTTRDAVTPGSLILWVNTLAHELFHFWNGQQMRGEPRATREWFSEGFTEYYANRTLVQEGLISEDLFIKKMEKHIGMYLYFKSAPAFAGVSIQQAGARKSYNRPGVYQGGWTVALCLDVMIREQTKGQRSLDEFMRRMYEQYGLSGKPYRYEDIVRTASEVAGIDLGSFFKNHVEGNEVIPVDEYLEKIGFVGRFKGYSGEVYIEKNSRATAQQKALGQRLMFGN